MSADVVDAIVKFRAELAKLRASDGEIKRDIEAIKHRHVSLSMALDLTHDALDALEAAIREAIRAAAGTGT